MKIAAFVYEHMVSWGQERKRQKTETVICNNFFTVRNTQSKCQCYCRKMAAVHRSENLLEANNLGSLGVKSDEQMINTYDTGEDRRTKNRRVFTSRHV